MNVFLWALIGYLAGSIPSAWIAAHLTGNAAALDGATHDAGEADAHLLLKEAGAGKAAAFAGTADVFKGLIPTLIAARFVGPHEAAACAVAVVAGHCWPPVLRRFAGRGLSAAAGAQIAILPVEFFFAGLLTALGFYAKRTGLASTVGFAAVPLLAMLRGQPAPYQLAAWAILAMILARRLEGVSGDVAAGEPPFRAVVRRAVFDASGRSS